MTAQATRDAPRAPSSPDRALALYWGDDAYGLEEATAKFRARMAEALGEPPERWRIRGDAGPATTVLAQLTERLATGSMFGAGTLAVVTGIGPLVRRGVDRDAFLGLFSQMAPGHGLLVIEETDAGKREAPHKTVTDAIAAAGGEIRRFQAPSAGGLSAWIEHRARDRGITLGPGAAKELATRVGGFVTENDVDRRRQGQIAAMELDKLALYRPSTAVSQDDIRALVNEAVPGSIWGFTDAVGMRRTDRAVELLELLLGTTPEPVLLAVLHRRVRELLEIADRLESGETPGSLVRTMKLNPYRAEQLVRQARQWRPSELERALDGLVEVDATVKGAPGMPIGDAQHRLAFVLWVAEQGAAPGAG
ncbi:MAG: DNA polymerase III subunit delta [Chloroflexota bacterium]